ncbi:unnamed protein product, partial [Thelazia callipaeda]|uniref:G-protein coupled receptors family 1 profile domain-containing protein n=1 Tax=Thelazia callipaeda TaxID=103827 RepID=A0A0N5CSM9_THECL
ILFIFFKLNFDYFYEYLKLNYDINIYTTYNLKISLLSKILLITYDLEIPQCVSIWLALEVVKLLKLQPYNALHLFFICIFPYTVELFCYASMIILMKRFHSDGNNENRRRKRFLRINYFYTNFNQIFSFLITKVLNAFIMLTLNMIFWTPYCVIGILSTFIVFDHSSYDFLNALVVLNAVSNLLL